MIGGEVRKGYGDGRIDKLDRALVEFEFHDVRLRPSPGDSGAVLWITRRDFIAAVLKELGRNA